MIKYHERMLVSFREGTLARISACSRNRSAFIRAAVDAALPDEELPSASLGAASEAGLDFQI